MAGEELLSVGLGSSDPSPASIISQVTRRMGTGTSMRTGLEMRVPVCGLAGPGGTSGGSAPLMARTGSLSSETRTMAVDLGLRVGWSQEGVERAEERRGGRKAWAAKLIFYRSFQSIFEHLRAVSCLR